MITADSLPAMLERAEKMLEERGRALAELVALKELHDLIEAAEARGTDNFVQGKPLPFAKDEYQARKVKAWAKARELAS